MKVFDCFKFFNELELLELRLMELYDVVDYFVLVEANKTHTGKEKKYLFEENKDKVYLKAHGYFTQFENCLNEISKLKINVRNYDSIKEYITEYKRVKEELNQIINIGI